jgi:hypothetical protein
MSPSSSLHLPPSVSDFSTLRLSPGRDANCTTCDYSLVGLTGPKCPECGSLIISSSTTRKEILCEYIQLLRKHGVWSDEAEAFKARHFQTDFEGLKMAYAADKLFLHKYQIISACRRKKCLEIVNALGTEAQIGIGETMKRSQPAPEWVLGQKNHFFHISLFSDEITQLCRTPFLAKDFYIRFRDSAAVKLQNWLRAQVVGNKLWAAH